MTKRRVVVSRVDDTLRLFIYEQGELVSDDIIEPAQAALFISEIAAFLGNFVQKTCLTKL